MNKGKRTVAKAAAFSSQTAEKSWIAMNSANKKSLRAKGIPQPFNRQAGHAPQFKPVVAQLKNAVSAQSVKSPVAPPVYRPQPTPKVLQQKTAPTHAALLSRTKGPSKTAPVRGPQTTKKVLQAKTKSIAEAARPMTGAARFSRTTVIAGAQPQRMNAAIQLSAPAPTPAPTPAPAPAPAPAPVIVVAAPVATKSEAEVQKAIEAEFKLWAADVKGGADTTKGWNTGFNGRGGKNESITKDVYDKLCGWWTKKMDKVTVPFSFKISNETINTFVLKAVSYRSAVSSQWDMHSKDALCDFLAQVGDRGGFNFHINVIGRF